MLEFGRIDLLLKAHRDRLLRQQFPLLAHGGLSSKVNFHHVVELHEQHLATPVAVDGHSYAFFAVGKVDEFLFDVACAVGADGVLEAAVQQVSNIVSTFNDNE